MAISVRSARLCRKPRLLHWGVLLTLAACLMLGVRHSLRAARCTIAMVERPMPARSAWQSWPTLPDLAGYSVVDLDPAWDPGLTSWRPHAMRDARLEGHGVCAERGASVQSWFGQYFTATSGDDWTIRLHREPKNGLIVVTGEPTRPGAERVEPEPVVAFEVERDGAVYFAVRVLAVPTFFLMLLVGWVWRGRRSGAPRSADGLRSAGCFVASDATGGTSGRRGSVTLEPGSAAARQPRSGRR